MSSSAPSLQSRFNIADIHAARRALARRNLIDFSQMIDIPTAPLSEDDYEDGFSVVKAQVTAAHHALLMDKIQGTYEGRIANLMVLMPPGSAKSTYADVVSVPWFMAKYPRRNVILASYATEIAEKQGRRARQLCRSAAFQNLMQVELLSDNKAAHQWTLSNGSEYMAGGLLSGLTGNRGALGILDDPIKGRAEAESDTIREKSWEAYINDFCSRLIPGSPQILIQTRWHEDDIAGRILPEKWSGESGLFQGRDGRMWDVLCLPAIADRRDDPLGRQIGETLWPEWFSLEHWKPFQMNSRTWTSLYQQKPTPDEGTFFQKSWFKRYRKGSEPASLNRYITTDHAPAGDTDSDFAVARVWGVDEGGDLYLLDGFREQVTMDVLSDRVFGMIRKHKPFAWFPEDDNNWKSVAGFIKRRMHEQTTYCRIEPISPHGNNKQVKAQAFQAMASMGRVFIPEGLDGDAIIGQYLAFPAGKNDDEVDAAALIGRAIADAHPAIVPPKEQKKFVDRWDRVFNGGEVEESDLWRTA